ncbi:putative cyclic nucleotide-gated ion channel 20, chloroplastic [Trifolium repens]|nr:putative cyclic nucleotide-gated ion channel 20, chloroplastic [Trifolium repens]
MESYEKETSLKKEHVGALCSVVVIGNKVENFKKEKVSPFHVTCDGENEHLGKSGALGMCDDPYCTTCPTYFKACQQSNPKDSTEYDPKFQSALYGDAKGFERKLLSIFSSLQKDFNCIAINWTMTETLFWLAYVSPESRVVGAGDLVDVPKKIAVYYLKNNDILSVLPRHLGLSGANYAKNLLRAVILVQYIPRLFRILNLLNGRSPTGFIFESARANFIINLLMFMLASNVVGSCWYLFGLQRVNQCLRDACSKSNIKGCIEVIDCGHGRNQTYQLADRTSAMCSNNSDAIACLDPSLDGFRYGIYVTAVPLTFETNMVKKYVCSHFWGLQQISTLAGGLTPSYFVLEEEG